MEEKYIFLILLEIKSIFGKNNIWSCWAISFFLLIINYLIIFIIYYHLILPYIVTNNNLLKN